MTKKEIVVSVLIVLLIGAIGAGGFVVWNHYHTWQLSVESVADNTAIANATPPSNEISLQTASDTNTDENALKVDTNTSSSNPAQLGSGQSNSASSSSNAVAPGPETFGQYNQYKTAANALFGDIKVGTGAEAVVGKKVAIYYKGWLTNGSLFDQSKASANGSLDPFIFTVGQHQVIPGMEQDIIGMKVGGTRRMIIPPAAGYKDQAQGDIPANSVLVFDVQLVAIE